MTELNPSSKVENLKNIRSWVRKNVEAMQIKEATKADIFAKLLKNLSIKMAKIEDENTENDPEEVHNRPAQTRKHSIGFA